MKTFYKLKEDGTVARGSGIVVPEGFNTDFSLIQLDEDGNFYEFYNQDGTPDLQRVQEKQLQELIASGEFLVKKYIQGVVDVYNLAHNVKFESVGSCSKYVGIDTYSHQQFCIDILAFNAQVWEVSRAVQLDIVNGVIPQPTEQEFLDMLPKYSGAL